MNAYARRAPRFFSTDLRGAPGERMDEILRFVKSNRRLFLRIGRKVGAVRSHSSCVR